MSDDVRPLRTCPKCGHAALMQPPCPMCAWQPAPPPAETHLLVGDQVVTVQWRSLAGVPVGDPVKTQPFWSWLERRRAQ